MPFRQALIRNHYVGRTFIEPSQAIRDFGVKLKLNPVRRMLEGQRVILVDDSIVRGTTSKQIIQMAREAGARKVYFASAAPPVRFPNVYGIDMPALQELVAAGRSHDEIARLIGADWLPHRFDATKDLLDRVESLLSAQSLCVRYTCTSRVYVLSARTKICMVVSMFSIWW